MSTTEAIHVSTHVSVPYTYGPDQTPAKFDLHVDDDGDVNLHDSAFEEAFYFNIKHVPALIAALQELVK